MAVCGSGRVWEWPCVGVAMCGSGHVREWPCVGVAGDAHFFQVNREYVLERFMEAHPVLKIVHSFEFEPFGSDQVRCNTHSHQVTSP